MSRLMRPLAIALMALCVLGDARADLVSVLQPGPISASTSVAFQNSNVTPGTIDPSGNYNFVDQWRFTLDGSFSVSSFTAAIDFVDQDSQAVLFGVTNLQVNLVSDSAMSSPIVSWQTVSAPSSGFQETLALVPPTPLGSGDYTLEVRGLVTQPGSYAGSLAAQPVRVVPLPGSFPLFLVALAALAVAARRRA